MALAAYLDKTGLFKVDQPDACFIAHLSETRNLKTIFNVRLDVIAYRNLCPGPLQKFQNCFSKNRMGDYSLFRRRGWREVVYFDKHLTAGLDYCLQSADQTNAPLHS